MNQTATPARNRPTTCARCGGTGFVAGGVVYPGTHAYRPRVSCPDCPVGVGMVARSDRMARQLAERVQLTRMLADELMSYPALTLDDWFGDCGRVTYESAGRRYVVSLTVTETT